MESLAQDLKYGLRSFMSFPLLTAVAVLALALGIGANTALFSVVNAILLRPAPVKNPDRLMVVWETSPRVITGEREGNEVAMANLTDWREQNQVFEDLTAMIYSNLNLQEAGEPERLQAALDASLTGTFRWNIETNDLSWDANLDRLFGLPPGKSVQSLENFI